MGRSAIIVQARMESTRLPGKVLLPLAGRTVLSHVLERCQAVEGADVVCCAVPDAAVNDPVAEEADRCGVYVSRGSERDVLDRYYKAACDIGADVVMRVTSDCPMIDPAICAGVLGLLRTAQADYACNNMPPSWPHGLDCEAVTFAWLERSASEARHAYEREHVTQYVRNHPEARTANLPAPRNDIEHHRWTLDTPADYRFLTAMFERLPPDRASWDYRVPLSIVEEHPALTEINAGQDRLEGLKKSVAAEKERGAEA